MSRTEKYPAQHKYQQSHKEYYNQKHREYYWKNRKSEEYRRKENLRAKENRRKLKLKVFTHYSNGTMRCACKGCYYSEHDCPIEFLSIDHINGNGIQHRKRVGTGNFFYFWLRKNNFPDGYQVLCHNCNQGRQLNDGVCPHENK